MSRRLLGSLVLASLLATAAQAQDVTSVVVGDGKSGKGSVNSVTIQGEDIYLDGVLQKEKYRPGSDIVIRDGKAAVVPHDPARDADKAARKAEARQARDAEKAALKARLKADKEAMKSEAKADKEAIKREALQGLEKGTTKTSVGSVVNKGGTVRIGDKVYRDDTPATEKDIPEDARKAIEDAKRMGGY